LLTLGFFISLEAPIHTGIFRRTHSARKVSCAFIVSLKDVEVKDWFDGVRFFSVVELTSIFFHEDIIQTKTFAYFQFHSDLSACLFGHTNGKVVYIMTLRGTLTETRFAQIPRILFNSHEKYWVEAD
jgi:hypothetical protein